jgi:hypothetical protein
MKILARKPATPIHVIDIEASGFGRDSYPIEIGIVMADSSEYQTLVRPESGWWHWDKSAEEVHGISRSDLFKYGRSVSQVCRDINHLCSGSVLYSDCWVHDSYWFRRLFDASHIASLVQCKAMEYLLGDEQQQSYQTIKQKLAVRLGLPMHRALNDAVVIQQALQTLTGDTRESVDRMEILRPELVPSANSYVNVRSA